MTEREKTDFHQMREMLRAMQAGELTVSRGIEILEMWWEGKWSDDMLPPVRTDLIEEDSTPVEIIDRLKQQLAEREKQSVLLKEAIDFINGRISFSNEEFFRTWSEKVGKALDATADLAGLVVCDAKHVAFSYYPYISAEYEHEEGFWSDSPFYSDHVPEGAKNIVTFYAAKEKS